MLWNGIGIKKERKKVNKIIIGFIEYRIIDKDINEKYNDSNDSVYNCRDKEEAEQKASQLNDIIGCEKFIVIERRF